LNDWLGLADASIDARIDAGILISDSSEPQD
jgi:hypothetical protein